MKDITPEDKDRVLGWFFEADVNGNEVPIESRNLDICAILENDGYIAKGDYRHVLTLKGEAFYLSGGYVKEKKEKERPLRIAVEANKKARNANIISLLAIVLAVVSFVFTHYTTTKEEPALTIKETKPVLADSTKDTTSCIVDTIKSVKQMIYR